MYKIILFSIVLLVSCNRIEAGKTLSKTDIQRIQQLGLLDEDEQIIKFYSEYKNSVAGNFFTDKRVAKYWIDGNDKSKNHIYFAFYPNIKSIDTIYNAGATYCPYMLITKNDGSQFQVCADGKREAIKQFFEGVIDKWKQNKLKK